MAELKAKQKRFCEEYIVDLNATQAAIRAGYSEKTAYSIGHENLNKPDIEIYIQELMQKRSDRTEITADMVLKELAKIGFGNIQNLYDEDGKMRQIHELEENVAATLQEVTEDSIGEAVIKRKYKMADKKSSLELIGRHLKMFTDKIEHSGGIDLTTVDDEALTEEIEELQRQLDEAKGG